MMMKLKPLKIWFGHNEELRKMIMQKLKLKGYKFNSYEYTNTNYFEFENTANTPMHCTGNEKTARGYFDKSDVPEATLSDIFYNVPERETLEIGGKKFYKDDFEEAVKNLEVINE